ncbi:arginase family protein [Kribbella deserti]|uniref:Arginase family protein n=1 Tax=Kribbella deserti TaxID=1926257 RepID=A0ABV6QFE6_9ACTN
MATIELLGVPSSAGAHWPGQEKAPAALRQAGLGTALREAGVDFLDAGDAPVSRWQPVREADGLSNASTVVAVARRTAERVGATLAEGRLPVVLGGDCSITVGAMAGLSTVEPEPGLVYFDGGFDLGTPATTPGGIADSMGLAHLLGEPGCHQPLASVGPTMAVDAVLGFGVNDSGELSDQRGLRHFASADVRRTGVAMAKEARELMEARGRRFLVHFDVDVIDFFDLPIADVPVHVDDHTGLRFALTMDCLDVFLASPALGGLVVTELNPDHAVPADIAAFAARLARSLTRTRT